MSNYIIADLKKYNALDWAKLLIIIGAVVLIGLFCVNQFVKFRYSALLLSAPCDVCLQLNNKITLCPKPYDVTLENIKENITIAPEVT